MRIFDQPDHRHYGPVRRLHLMLLQLTVDIGMDAFEEPYVVLFQQHWDHHLVQLLDEGMHEAEAQRLILNWL